MSVGFVMTASALWIITLILLWRLWRNSSADIVWDKKRTALWAGLILTAATIFFRPHEDIFGGQDTGAYLNGSVAFAREGSLSYKDPLLSQLSAAEMTPFVTTKMYSAKYHCLWLPDPAKPIMRTWFQPAFPIMAGILTKVAPDRIVLYIIPLLAILFGLALRALAMRLFDHPWAGEAAFTFYILSPMVVWHARYPRPEVIAGMFIAGGLTLLLTAWQRPRGNAWLDLLMGAICINLAPFFHISSGSAVLIIALFVIAAIICGRDDFFIFPLVSVGMSAIFLHQLFNIQDTYGLRRFIPKSTAHWIIITIVAITAGTVLYILSAKVRQSRESSISAEYGSKSGLRLRIMGTAIILAVIGLIAWQGYHTTPQELKLYITRFVWRTDLRCVVEMVSLPIALIALAGIIIIALRSGKGILNRWIVLTVMLFTSLIIGNMYDFFLTRYMMVTLLPLIALALTATVTLIPVTGRRSGAVFTVTVIALCLLGMNNRTLLIKHTQFKGFVNYIESIANELKQDDAVLLCEYPNIAAPLDLFCGVPTLSLNNEHFNDYTAAENSWRKIMQQNPDKKAFFATPFERIPLSTNFDFIPKGVRDYSGKRLVTPRWDLPKGTAEWGCGLRIYQMLSKNSAAADSTNNLPQTMEFGSGNMGIRNFRAPRMNSSAPVFCTPLDSTAPLDLKLNNDIGNISNAELLIILHSASAAEQNPEIKLNGRSLDGHIEYLIKGWQLYRTAPAAITGGDKLTICGNSQTAVAAIRLAAGKKVIPVFDSWKEINNKLIPVKPFNSRWTSENSEFLVSTAPQDTTYLLTFTLAPSEWGKNAQLCLYGETTQKTEVPTDSFVWEVWPIYSKSNTAPIKMDTIASEISAKTNSVTTMPANIGYAATVKAVIAGQTAPAKATLPKSD